MGMASPRTRISMIFSLSLRARVGRAPARVRACGDTKESRRARHGEEKRRDRETEGGNAGSESAKPGARRRKERVREEMKKWFSHSPDPASLTWSLIQQAAAAESPPWVGKRKEKRIRTMPPKVSNDEIWLIHSAFIEWRNQEGWSEVSCTPADEIRIEKWKYRLKWFK